MILTGNSIDHAVLAFAAMSLGVPVAAISPQYGLAGADLSRLAHAVELLAPGAVMVDDATAFAGALESDILAGLPVIATRERPTGRHRIDDPAARRALRSSTARPKRHRQAVAHFRLDRQPKAVMCLHEGVAVNAAQIAACYDDPEPPVVVNQAPWSHSLGANAILQMVLQRGGTHYIDAGQPVAGRFGETVRNLKEIAPTYHNMVPAGWDLLASELERNAALAERFFSRVRVLQYGGAALWSEHLRSDPGRGEGDGRRGDQLRQRVRGHRDRALGHQPAHWPEPDHGPHGPATPENHREAHAHAGPSRIQGEGASGLARLLSQPRGHGGGLRRGGVLLPWAMQPGPSIPTTWSRAWSSTSIT